MESLTPRQAINVAYTIVVEDMTAEYRCMLTAGHKFETDNPLQDQIVRWEETVGLRYNPDELTMFLHKQWLKQRGIEWDDTSIEDTPFGAAHWKERDEEIPGVFMGDPKDPGRKGR